MGEQAVGSINTRCKLALDTFKYALSLAKLAKCSAFVVCGDLFDTDKPEPAIIRAVQNVIEQAGLKVYLLVGNHDRTSDAPYDHALAPLSGVAFVAEHPCIARVDDCDVLFYPHMAADMTCGDVQQHMPYAPNGASVRYIAIHRGVYTDRMPKYLHSGKALSLGQARQLRESRGAKAMFCGDYHETEAWSAPDSIVQCGALVPTGWDQTGFSTCGRMYVMDGDQLHVVSVPGPRFKTVEWAEDLFDRLHELQPLEVEASRLFVQVRVQATQLQVARETLEQHGGQVLGVVPVVYEFVVKDDAAKEASHRAAACARASETLNDALAAYVEQLALTPFQRNEVLSRCQGYLKG
jgi:hypothetical protein